MERKAFHALLLSGIVAAGAVTISSDAYAQTNTERLMDVKANTDGLPGMLEALMTAIEEGVASILAAISGLQTSVDTGLGAIDTDLQAIDADLQSIHGDLSNVDSHVEEIHGDLGAIDMDLMEVHEDLSDVNAGIAAIDGDVMTVNDNVASLNAKVDSLTQTVNALGQAGAAIEGLVQANTATQDGVNSNAAAITELKGLLMSVSEAVGVVQTTVEKPAEPEKASVGTMLFSDDNKFSVLVSAFSQNKPADSSYTTTLTFACKEHVFLNTAKVSSPTTPFVRVEGDPGITDTGAPVITILVDDQPAYSTIFRLTEDATKSEYKAGVSFKLKPLAAGDEIKVRVSTDKKGETEANRDAERLVATNNDKRAFTLFDYVNASARDRVGERTDQANLTKLDAGKAEVFKLDMSWYSSAADAGCTLKSPVSPATAYTDLGETVTHALVATGANIQKDITTVTFSCTENTAITKVTLEGIPGSFASFASLKITTDKDKALKFTDVGGIATADIADKPFEFAAGTFDVSGKIPAAAAIIAITYDTVNDGACTYKAPAAPTEG